MKKIIFLTFCLAMGFAGFAQDDTAKVKFPEYVNDGTIPNFSVVAAPDSSRFTDDDIKKNKPLLVMIFSPECGHCQHETKLIEANMDHFKNTQILMVTWMPYSSLSTFSTDYGTAKFSNITLAQDPNDFFYGYYEVHRYPKLIIYNEDGNYVSDYDGNIELENVWKDLGEK